MSAVTTGRHKGTVKVLLPKAADELFTQSLMEAIYQLDHVESISVEGRFLRVVNDLVPYLKGQALADTLIAFDDELTDVLNGLLHLIEAEQHQRQRDLQFSHRG